MHLPKLGYNKSLSLRLRMQHVEFQMCTFSPFAEYRMASSARIDLEEEFPLSVHVVCKAHVLLLRSLLILVIKLLEISEILRCDLFLPKFCSY